MLEAADDLLVERGFAGVTIEGIAASAQVAKQTIYRWWTSKTDILFDALAADAAEYFTAHDYDDLGSDLRHHLRQLPRSSQTPTLAPSAARCRQAQHDPGSRPASAPISYPQRNRDRAPFPARKAAANCLTTDIDLAIDQLVGPVYYRVLSRTAGPAGVHRCARGPVPSTHRKIEGITWMDGS